MPDPRYVMVGRCEVLDETRVIIGNYVSGPFSLDTAEMFALEVVKHHGVTFCEVLTEDQLAQAEVPYEQMAAPV